MKKKMNISGLNKYAVKNVTAIIGGGSKAIANIITIIEDTTETDEQRSLVKGHGTGDKKY